MFPSLKPESAEKDAWGMRTEFLELPDDDWTWQLQHFLNRWGLWSYGYGFHVGLGEPLPGYALVFPQLLMEKRDEYRKALAIKNPRKWLSTAPPLSFTTIDKPPYHLVERSYCEDAIRATITIDHLEGRQFGFCKRCRKQFEHETRHSKNYCSRQCIQAAGVQRWRAKKKKEAKRKGTQRNAKS